ncbi:hypothetical protein BVRB_7g179460 [Beta vulgaris subsp. vulgaris]|uniref:NAC domain-containing protein n=2 Tax=Beta vulgaris subsp. vulgaris TaxID=3555 RepID=A0A0J8BAM4_BETVV|nr:hypothetical protein BVRB_7g179460 [Beta vulgaris subsp. vulgaris]
MKQPDENDASSISSCNKPENDTVSNSKYFKTFPSGYRFEPLDQELILDYLVPKLKGHKLPRHLMHPVNLYDHDPEYLSANYEAQGPKTWYFFTSMNTSSRNRYRSSKNENGWWKLTGQTTTIKNDDDEVIGSRRKLFFNFYLPKEGGDDNTRWIVHEFEVQGKCKLPQDQKNQTEEKMDHVLCKLFKITTRSSTKSKGQKEEKSSPEKEQDIDLKSDCSVDLNANGNDNDNDNDNVNGNEEGSGKRPILPDLNN